MAADEIRDITGRMRQNSLEERHTRIQDGSRRRVRVLPADKLRKTAEETKRNVTDAAAFLVQVPRPMSWLKMQDLLYLAQAWHLVWDGELLFPDPIVATEDGISIPRLHDLLAGKFEVTRFDLRMGRDSRLSESARRTLSGMVKFYGDRSHYRLSEMFLTEEPWLRAREAAPDFIIDPAILHRHYRSKQ